MNRRTFFKDLLVVAAAPTLFLPRSTDHFRWHRMIQAPGPGSTALTISGLDWREYRMNGTGNWVLVEKKTLQSWDQVHWDSHIRWDVTTRMEIVDLRGPRTIARFTHITGEPSLTILPV